MAKYLELLSQINEFIILLNMVLEQLFQSVDLWRTVMYSLLVLIIQVATIYIRLYKFNLLQKFDLMSTTIILVIYWINTVNSTFTYIIISLVLSKLIKQQMTQYQIICLYIGSGILSQFDKSGFQREQARLPMMIGSFAFLIFINYYQDRQVIKKIVTKSTLPNNITQIEFLSNKYSWLVSDQAYILNQSLEIEYQFGTQSIPYFKNMRFSQRLSEVFIDEVGKERYLRDHCSDLIEMHNQNKLKQKFFYFHNFQINVFVVIEDTQDNLYLIVLIKSRKDENSQSLYQVCQSISRELSNSLNNIIMLSTVYMQSDNVTQVQKTTYIEPMLSNVQQLLLKTNNLKDYHNIISNNFQIQISKFDIVEEILEIVEYFAFSIQQKGIKLVLNFMVLDAVLETDKNRVKQIFYQLLSNAVRFTQGGIITIEIKRESLSQIVIIVEDQGIGMQVEEVKRLEQLLNGQLLLKVSDNQIKFGLGLFISNSISLKLYQRQIEFQSSYQKGSRFCFYIINQKQTIFSQSQNHKTNRIKFFSNNTYRDNLFEISQTMKSTTQKTATRNSHSKYLSSRLKQTILSFKTMNSNHRFSQNDQNDSAFLNISDEESLDLQLPQLHPHQSVQQIDFQLRHQCCKKALIVDDDYFNIFALQKLIQILGLESDYSFNGLEALHKIKNKERCESCDQASYQLIFLELYMPILDGIQTVIEIKNLQKNKKISENYCILSSAYGDLQTKQQAFESGIDYFLTKPVEIFILKELIQRFLDTIIWVVSLSFLPNYIFDKKKVNNQIINGPKSRKQNMYTE
ncbi:hypothetical protein pb186bvf_010985 [Paramecium bursaria]